MDSATKRLLDAILMYSESAPPNVSKERLDSLKEVADGIMDDAVSMGPVTPGQRAVAEAMGTKEPEPKSYDPNEVIKSPGQREVEALSADRS